MDVGIIAAYITIIEFLSESYRKIDRGVSDGLLKSVIKVNEDKGIEKAINEISLKLKKNLSSDAYSILSEDIESLTRYYLTSLKPILDQNDPIELVPYDSSCIEHMPYGHMLRDAIHEAGGLLKKYNCFYQFGARIGDSDYFTLPLKEFSSEFNASRLYSYFNFPQGLYIYLQFNSKYRGSHAYYYNGDLCYGQLPTNIPLSRINENFNVGKLLLNFHEHPAQGKYPDAITFLSFKKLFLAITKDMMNYLYESETIINQRRRSFQQITDVSFFKKLFMK